VPHTGFELLPSEVIGAIERLAGDRSLSFQQMSQRLIDSLKPMNGALLLQHLEYAGIIPERYGHDSTEEKLYAKYCDFLLAESLAALGLNSMVIQERADAPDVKGESPGRYTMVGDAKGFRLSRTAKNQKDFKVEALNDWRGEADYACMVSPIFQYPTKKSQIYSQARARNVTLLSFTHLHLMLKSLRGKSKPDLEPLWKIPGSLPKGAGAQDYWQAIDSKMLELSSASQQDWNDSKNLTSVAFHARAQEEIEFWDSEKDRLGGLTKTDLLKELIKALKVNGKIEKIKKMSQSS